MLGWSTPEYAHLPMVLGSDGHKLSKQTQAPVLDSEKNVENLYQSLQVLGFSPPIEALSEDPDSLIKWAIASWDISAVPQTAAAAPLC